MTGDRTDRAAESIDWPGLLAALAAASTFAEMADVLHGSGVLISRYQEDLPYERNLEDVVDTGDLPTLRATLTALVREDHFACGAGDASFWEGELDMVIEAIADRVGYVYPLLLPEYVLPRRIPPCPTCGSIDRVAVRIFGMPPAPPEGFDMDRVIFEGCTVMGEPAPSFHCRRDGTDFDHPGLSEAELWIFSGDPDDA